MPPIGQDSSGSAAYRPTSLDFINLPNPIEPHTQAQKHPLNGTPRLDKARLESSSNQNLFKLLIEPCNERPPKRHKATDNTLLDLPRLPVRTSAKRLRIPPTLSGLHQPPPDAGLLPSISVEQPQVPPPRSQDASVSHKNYSEQSVAPQQSSAVQIEAPIPRDQASKPAQSRSQRNKWTESETADLLKGVAKFGIGSWTKILNCSDYQFHRRTALDLKDRFRVCCPDHYNPKKKTKKVSLPDAAIATTPSAVEEEAEEEAATLLIEAANKKTKGPASGRVSSSQLKDLGIDEPFAKSSRRSRHAYSEVEDEAILRGFHKYGKSWSSIRKDPSLNLSKRNPRDLRDRMRTRYPKEYAEAGLALPAEKHGNKRETGTSSAAAVPDNEGRRPPSTNEDSSTKDDIPAKYPAKRPTQHSIFNFDDVYLNGLPHLNDNEYLDETEPIVLDRGILDWAPRTNNTVSNSGIDPRMTLKLPKPVSTVQQSGMNQDRGQHHLQAMPSQNLPSLAAFLPSEKEGGEGQLELPSVMQWYNPSMDEGGSGKNSILTLDELMS